MSLQAITLLRFKFPVPNLAYTIILAWWCVSIHILGVTPLGSGRSGGLGPRGQNLCPGYNFVTFSSFAYQIWHTNSFWPDGVSRSTFGVLRSLGQGDLGGLDPGAKTRVRAITLSCFKFRLPNLAYKFILAWWCVAIHIWGVMPLGSGRSGGAWIQGPKIVSGL